MCCVCCAVRRANMFATTRQLMQQLDWSPYLENTGANFNEDGEYQMSNPDPDGLVCVGVNG